MPVTVVPKEVQTFIFPPMQVTKFPHKTAAVSDRSPFEMGNQIHEIYNANTCNHRLVTLFILYIMYMAFSRKSSSLAIILTIPCSHIHIPYFVYAVRSAVRHYMALNHKNH